MGRLVRGAAGALLAGLLLTSAGPADAATSLPAAGSAPIPPVDTRPVDPDAECQGGGPDIVDLPPAQRRLGAEESWGVTRGAGVLVAVIGSGVDATHPQLAGRVDRGVDVVFPGAFGDADCVGQGTVIAGLVAGSEQPGIGFHGVAPAARILPVRVTLDGLESTPDLLAQGIETAVAENASVILVTLPMPVGSDRLAAAVDAAESADVLVVAPADPLPEGVPGYTYPATYQSVLAVSALDADGVPAAAGAGDVAVVDLVAPGEGVVGPLPGRGHTVAITGTLPAAAYVAGSAALVRSAYPDLSVAEVRHRLEVTADHPGRAVPDVAVGWGVVNPLVAVSAEVAPTPREPVIDPKEAVSGPQPPASPDRTSETRAMWFALAGALAGAVVLIGVRVVPSGRKRGWRPGRAAAPPGLG